MSAEDWANIENVPTFLQSNSWEEKIGGLSKAQLLLIAKYLNMEIVEGTKIGVFLLKVVEMIKSSKVKMDESSVQNESVLLDKQFQLQEIEMAKIKLQMQLQEKERVEREKQREHELTVLRLKQGMVQDQFNVITVMKLVPAFDEKM